MVIVSHTPDLKKICDRIIIILWLETHIETCRTSNSNSNFRVTDVKSTNVYTYAISGFRYYNKKENVGSRAPSEQIFS